MSAEHFRANTPQTIHEVIEGEVILVNLETGAYFSTDLAGAAVWQAILRGLSEEEIIAQLTAQFSGEAEEIHAGVQALIRELLSEGLIVPDAAVEASTATPTTTMPDSAKPRFVAPMLHKYTEMADLLLLDPIHDVDDSGWPAAKENIPPNKADGRAAT